MLKNYDICQERFSYQNFKFHSKIYAIKYVLLKYYMVMCATYSIFTARKYRPLLTQRIAWIARSNRKRENYAYCLLIKHAAQMSFFFAHSLQFDQIEFQIAIWKMEMFCL